jgi:stringent starvation protein B
VELRLPPSAKPQLLRAAHEWCSDNGLTPYLMVAVDTSVSVPKQFVSDGQIILNTSYEATGSLRIANDFITFQARFGGKPQEVVVPIHRVMALFAKETGEGAYFDASDAPLQTAAGMAPIGSQKEQEEPQLRQLLAALNRNKDAFVQSPATLPPTEGVGSAGDNDDPPPSPPAKPGQKPFLVRVK